MSKVGKGTKTTHRMRNMFHIVCHWGRRGENLNDQGTLSLPRLQMLMTPNLTVGHCHSVLQELRTPQSLGKMTQHFFYKTKQSLNCMTH